MHMVSSIDQGPALARPLPTQEGPWFIDPLRFELRILSPIDSAGDDA
jgi:hypothetical protein